MPNIKHGDGPTEYGPGVSIRLSGDELARAVDLFLYAQGVLVQGPRTITYNDELLEDRCEVYVDPSGCVLSDGVRLCGDGKVE